jgi:hypothetical protein
MKAAFQRVNMPFVTNMNLKSYLIGKIVVPDNQKTVPGKKNYKKRATFVFRLRLIR